MSLLLRKECQEVLDNIGLSTYHAEIKWIRPSQWSKEKKGRFLSIVGECGKELVTLHGITFSRSSPSKAEIVIAAELLQEFLSNHRKTIKDLIQIGAVANKIPTQPACMSAVDNVFSGYVVDSKRLSYIDDVFKITIDVKGDIKNVGLSHDSKKQHSYNSLFFFKFDQTQYNKARKHLKTIRKSEPAFVKAIHLQAQAKEQVDLLKAKLMNCDV